MITRDLECPWHDYCVISVMTSHVLDMIIALSQLWRHERWFRKYYSLSANQKRVRVQCIRTTDIELIIQINVSCPHTCIIPYLFLLAGQATAMAQSSMKMFPTMWCLLCLPLVTFCATPGKKSSPGSSQDKVSSLYLISNRVAFNDSSDQNQTN